MTYKKFIKYKNIKNSVQPGDRIFVKSYGFFPFAKNMGKQFGKNISKNTARKNSRKTAERAGNLCGNKIFVKITKVSKNSQTEFKQNNSETVTSEHDKEIPKERFVYSEERQNYWWSKIDLKVI